CCTSQAVPVVAQLFFFNEPAPTESYTLSLHDALPISASTVSKPNWSSRSSPPIVLLLPRSSGCGLRLRIAQRDRLGQEGDAFLRSEEHTSELQSLRHLVCRLLLEKKKISTQT